MTTKGDVETAYRRFRNAARELGINSIIQLEIGARGKGIAHRLEVQHPGLDHPVIEVIGVTFGEAERFLRGAAVALETVRGAERYGGLPAPTPAQSRKADTVTLEEAIQRPDYSTKGTFGPRRARSNTRKGQDPWHPELPL